jgi:small subunit ribosomal protein S15e
LTTDDNRPEKRKGTQQAQLQRTHARTSQRTHSRASCRALQSQNEKKILKKYRLNNLEIKHKYIRLYAKCKKSKKNTQPGEKPVPVKTHLRNAIVLPEMVGNNVAVYNGKLFNNVEIKFDMIGRYLGEFSLSYKPCRHGKAGVGATKGSAHSSLK